MSETLPEQDCLFPDFTRECANYVNFEIATKQRTLSANTVFTTFTSLHNVNLIITKTAKSAEEGQSPREILKAKGYIWIWVYLDE